MKRPTIRTLFLTQWFDPEPGALRGLPLAKWLRQRGHQVEVLTGFPNYPGGKLYTGYRLKLWQKEVMSDIPVLRVPLYPSHDHSALKRVANYSSFALSASTIGAVLSGATDVAFVYHPPPTVGLAAMVLKVLKSIPFVYHIADMWPESVLESGMVAHGIPKRMVGSLLNAWCGLVYKQARVITVLSPGFKRLLVERGVPPEKIHVIYNWADDELFRPIPRDPDLAEQLGFTGRFNIVYAGNLGTVQGLETVVRAAKRISHIRDIQIVVIGTGQKEKELKSLALEIGAHNVLFLGRRQYWEMPQVNCLADVLLVHLKDLPVFSATIPSKTQVSLACGRPVLMAVRGDSADLIRKAEAGITCEPENESALAAAMIQLYKMDRSELQRMGARGRQFYMNEMALDVGGARLDALLRTVCAVCGDPPLVS